MRIIHISDTHGSFPPLPEGDVVVHSGDLMPNRSRGDEREPAYQKSWLLHHRKQFVEWLAGRPMLLCRGNHDFTPLVQPILRDGGCNITDITNRLHEHGGLRFFGFPYVHYMCGEWNFEVTEAEIGDKTRAIPWGQFDIIVAHAPIAGILDECYGDHIGNRAMANALNYDVPRHCWPRAYLHGHAHEANGIDDMDGMIVSNAATVVRDITV